MPKRFDLSRSCDGLSMWSVDFTCERGGPVWKWPQVQHWRDKDTGSCNFRIGWRFIAIGVHLSRQHLTSDQVELLKKEADK